MAFKTDAAGIIQEGRFAGYNVADVVEWAEKQSSSSSEEPTPPPEREAPPTDPRTRLAADAAGRVDRTTALLAMQQEQGDEAAFAATVKDYDTAVPGVTPEQTYRQLIAEIKKTMPMEQRIQAGLHRRMYVMIKAEKDTAAADTLFGRTPAAHVPVAEETPAEEQEEELAPPPPVTPPPVAEAPKKKAAPPASTPPTPASRAAAPPKAAKPKLVINDKVRRYCRSIGQDENEYLLKLEQRGFSQADLDKYAVGAGAASARPAGRRSVYDHSDE
jgi:hypothetical protein